LEPRESHPERVERLFHEASEIESGSRDAFLAGACAGDESLRLAVGRLLDAAERVGRNPAWGEPAIHIEAHHTAAQEMGDATLQRYRLIAPIGAGGMGQVFKAVRADDEFSKLVAIKIVQRGFSDDSQDAIVRRFRQERQILAGLEHPNIARLLDGGSTPDGLPFLVMEYVEGLPIDRYLAAKKPPLREILQLFRTVCSAVSHAHTNLVVHRDLKPGNILVTEAGTPKLLDFGIAKLLDGAAERTRTGAGAMTPEYASPEQVRGAAITTSTDVYSLGVLLYELLSGARPYRATASTMELAEAICNQTPEPMSARAGRRFDADLENIVQMALRKEPERRYTSAEQFSEDLRRYLEGYPVAARAATRGYRARRFAGRNKAALAAAALVSLSLLAGTAATAWEAHVADRRFNDLRKLANSYLFEFHDAIKDLPGSTPARQLVVKRALEYLDRLSRERGNDAELSRELASAYEKVGAVQGLPRFQSLGDRVGALASYRKALAIRERLAAASPNRVDIGTELSQCYLDIGFILQQAGDLRGASETLRKAVRLTENLAAAHPSDALVRDKLALAYAETGDVLGSYNDPNLGDAKGAMEYFRQSIAIREKLVAENPADRNGRLFLAALYTRLGNIRRAQADNPGAVESLRKALGIEERLVREEPVKWLYRREVAIDKRTLALLFRDMGNLQEARKYGDESAAIFSQLAKEDPQNMQSVEELADSDWSQGSILAKSHDRAGAQAYYDSAIAGYGRVMAHAPGNYPPGLVPTYQLIATLAIESADTGKATRAVDKEMQIADRLLAINAANETARRNQGVAYLQMGQAHELLARTQASEWHVARSWYQRSLDIWLDLQRKGTLIPRYAPRLDEAAQGVAKCDRALDNLPGK